MPHWLLRNVAPAIAVLRNSASRNRQWELCGICRCTYYKLQQMAIVKNMSVATKLHSFRSIVYSLTFINYLSKET
jgi:hypothetical protein